MIRILRSLMITMSFYITCSGQTTLLTESFESTTFPPTGWVNLQGGTGNLWTRTNTVTAQSGSWMAGYVFNSTNAANAWMISSGITMISGITYTIKYYQRVNNASYPEKLKVTIGSAQTIAAQATVLQDLPSLTNTAWVERTITYTPTSNGTYYVGFNCYSAADQSRLFIDNVQVIEPALPTSPFFQNLPASLAITSFNNIRVNNPTPPFTIRRLSAGAFNRVQIEMNTQHDFAGTAYQQTFSGSYVGGTSYDFTCNALSPSALPNVERVYFVRSRVSADGGSNWSAWSTQKWYYTYSNAARGYHVTAQQQFEEGISVATNYGNFLTINNNATATSTYLDDYLQVNEGSFNQVLSPNADQYLTEGTGNFSGNGSTYLTIGSYYLSGSQYRDYHAFRFQGCAIPPNADILTSNLKVYAHNTGGEPAPNSSNPLYLKILGVNQANCNAWANSTNTATGDPRNRVRTTQSVNWDIIPAWTDVSEQTSPDLSDIIEPLVALSGYAAGNALGLIIDYNGANHTTDNRHRYFSTGARGTAYRPVLQGTFTNFSNSISYTKIPLNAFGPSAKWGQFIPVEDETGCGTCTVNYRIYVSGTSTLIASGPGTLSLAGAYESTAMVDVYIDIYRNASPKLISFTLTATTTPLPIELASFSAACDAEQSVVISQWKTASEKNNDYFSVLRTADLEHWEEIGTVQGAGNSNKKADYQFTDRHPLSGLAYYALKQTDYDGKSKTFEPVSVICTTEQTFAVFPNPAKGHVSVVLTADDSRKVTVALHDMYGRLVKSDEFMAAPGENKRELSLDQVAAGIYNVRLSIGNVSSGMVRLVVE